MSADYSYRMDRAELARHANTYEACDCFEVREGESRHHCATCDNNLAAHVIVALRDTLQAERALIAALTTTGEATGK